MATLVVETGSGSATANTYISLADADSYLADHDESTYWRDSTDDEKNQALIIATRYIDAMYRHRWVGTKASSTQALAWPRSSAEDEDGYTLASTAVPAAIKNAAVELAVRELIETDGILPDVDGGGLIEEESFRVGPLSESITYRGGKSHLKRFTLIDALLSGLLYPVTYVERS
jgi:hypothetical protein